MDSTFGICGKDWCIVVCDSSVNRSIFNLKRGEDKIAEIDSKTVLGLSGEQTDRSTFSSLVTRNLKLNEYKMGFKANLDQQAQFTRTLLAEALRQGPYQVNCLLGGYCDQDNEAKLYWMDYLGTLQRVTRGAQGYANYFVSSVLEKHFKKDLTLDEGKKAISDCILELTTRFIINSPEYLMKIITKDGIEVVKLEAPKVPTA